jgi:hypothetical protein
MKKTAQSEYSRLQKENAELLKLIAAELKRDSKRKEINYGHVGNLGHVKEQLIEVLSFMRNADEEDDIRARLEKEITK